jgi:hypothetical protein
MKHFFGELSVAIAFLALLFVIFNPWNVVMPTYLEVVVLVALMAVFGAFAIFIWRENGGDEREQLHRMFSDRLAFLTGSGILLIGVVVGEWQHQLNQWILFTLAAMVIAKAVGLIYSKMKL